MKTCCLVLLLALAPATAFAQGQDSASSSAAPSGNQTGSVDIGAGASSAATSTGSSGPAGAGGARTPQPLRASFSLKPPEVRFWGPGLLPIATNPAKRCDVIQHETARRRCESPDPVSFGAAR